MALENGTKWRCFQGRLILVSVLVVTERYERHVGGHEDDVRSGRGGVGLFKMKALGVRWPRFI